MKKREFLSGSAALMLGAVTAASAPLAAAGHPEQQVILTITGALGKSNRGKSDEMVDQLMHRHGIHFAQAFTFTLAELLNIPAQTIRPTIEYDGKIHELRGPRLMDVLNLAGLLPKQASKLVFHGIDGYSPEVKFDLAQKANYIVATHFDGRLLAIGGFGPLFLIYDADHHPEASQQPLKLRFASCPWGLYCIEVA